MSRSRVTVERRHFAVADRSGSAVVDCAGWTPRDPFGALLLAAIVVLIGLLAYTFDPALVQAHTITKGDCRAVARATPGSANVKRAAALGCRRHAAAHQLDHRHQRCERLTGGYRRRNACTIRITFRSHGDEAVTVAVCESGLSTRAVGPLDERGNPRLGLFQLGTYERSKAGAYTTRSSARVQAESAFRWFQLTGNDWGAWECKP